MGAICVALTVVALAAWRDAPVPVDAVEPCSVLAGNFVHHGRAPQELIGEFQASTDPLDPVRTVHWQGAEQLTERILELLREASRRQLDGSRREQGRLAALDLVFASNHSLRVALAGDDGELVGEIVVDRSQPSPGRAGLAAAFERLARDHAGQFTDVQVHTVFLLNCGSREDHADHQLVRDTVLSITGRPLAHLLTTSGKVCPGYRCVEAGYATSEPITLYDAAASSPGEDPPPCLHIGSGGIYDFSTGQGVALEIPPRR